MTSGSPTIVLCGAGMIAGAHAAAAALLQMPIIGVASRSAERTTEQAERLGTAALSYEDLPAGGDIVVISTPPQCHAAHTIAMLRTGAAVVVEKPLCTTLDDADAMLAAAAASAQRVLYAENLAYAPMVAKLLAMTPAMGPLNSLEVRTLQTLPTWGEFTSDEWGGGALFDLGVHPLALAVLVAGASRAGPVVSVSATMRGGEGHNSDEHAEVELKFGSGLIGHVVSSWQAIEGQTWDIQVSSASSVLRGDFWPSPSLEHNGDAVRLPAGTPPLPLIEELGYAGQLRSFRDDLASGTTPFMDVAFGRLILDIVCAAYQSAGRGGAPESVPFRGDRSRTPLQLWHAGST